MSIKHILKPLLCVSLVLNTITAKSIVGTNIGGWMVLEPWITPSLFYRFLGGTESKGGVAFDTFSFCELLGAADANTILREHWDNWVDETYIEAMVMTGVEMVRLPIGDWVLGGSYEPYRGCFNGAAEKIDWFMDTAAKNGIKVWIDVHGL